MNSFQEKDKYNSTFNTNSKIQKSPNEHFGGKYRKRKLEPNSVLNINSKKSSYKRPHEFVGQGMKTITPIALTRKPGEKLQMPKMSHTHMITKSDKPSIKYMGLGKDVQKRKTRK